MQFWFSHGPESQCPLPDMSKQDSRVRCRCLVKYQGRDVPDRDVLNPRVAWELEVVQAL